MTVAADASVIRVGDLRKRYDDVVAVDGISFEVARGEIFGLLGPNGAGKTTTIEILEGLGKLDSGTVSVLGLDPVREGAALKERIGVQLQTAALYPNLNVVELIDVFRSFYKHARPTERARPRVRPRGAPDGADQRAVRRPAPAAFRRACDGQRP